MSESGKKFHQFALQSILFKGRSDWYFCFLKAERIAHVLAVLSDQSPSTSVGKSLGELAHAAGELPQTVLHFVAGEVDPQVVLADMFSLLTAVRLAGTSGNIGEQNARVLIDEYEHLVERFANSLHPSPFATAEDFAIPGFGALGALAPAPQDRLPEIGQESQTPASPSSDSNKGQAAPVDNSGAKEAKNRTAVILDFVRKHKRVSIKDISAVVRGCSEKTIQRELSSLIDQGLIKKVGERRWSVYLPVPTGQ